MQARPRRFRILIVGRANAGKTTILKKLCGETEIPIIREESGNMIFTGLNPNVGRGMHNVEQEIIYPSRPGFVMHDSSGFEAGSVSEMETLKAFIAKRGQSNTTDEQLHVIWFCIPTDDDRPLPPKETEFFEIDTGKVPVIAIFTKYDGLETKAYSELRNVHGRSMSQAKQEMAAVAEDLFQKYYVERLKTVKKQPAAHVRLHDLHKPEGDVDALINRTAEVSQNLILTALAQNYDLEKRKLQGIPNTIKWLAGRGQPPPTTEEIVRRCLAWVSHVWSIEDLPALDLGSLAYEVMQQPRSDRYLPLPDRRRPESVVQQPPRKVDQPEVSALASSIGRSAHDVAPTRAGRATA